MPTEVAAPQRHPLAARRILRLALGTALCLWFSQVAAWTLSFVAPVLALMILSLPLPPPRLKQGIGFVVALLLPLFGGMALLPFLEHQRGAGIALVALALFYSFYYTARGGSAVLGTFMTIGLTVVVTVGSVNAAIMLELVQSLGISAAVAMAFVWLAHALLPDPPLPPLKRPRSPPPEPAEATRLALRSLLVVLPLALVFLFVSGSPAYTVVMIKVATMGQQATSEQSRQLGRDMLTSTACGGLGAVIAWQLLLAWPSLTLYTLLVGLAGLLYGRGIFQGPALHPKFSTWNYAYLTMIVILAPAVLDGLGSDGTGAAFWTRLWLFVLIGVYGTAAVAVFDAFWPAERLSTARRGAGVG